MAKKTIEVTPEQVRLAKTKVEADARSGRTSDPMLVLVATGGLVYGVATFAIGAFRVSDVTRLIRRG